MIIIQNKILDYAANLWLVLSVSEAKKWAKTKHKDQLSKDGFPFIEHLQKVVTYLKLFEITDSEILCAGWLHDIIEKTNTDYDSILKKFGKNTADFVSYVSKDNRLPKSQREKEYVSRLEKSPWQAQIIKLADIMSHFETIDKLEDSDNKIQKKIMYLNAIQPRLSSNKQKIPQLKIAQEQLNPRLERFGHKLVF